MENNKKKNNLPKLIGIIGILVLVFGITYAIFTVTLNGTKKVKIKTGTINLRLLDKDNNYVDELNPDADTGFDIKLENTVPMTYEEAIDRDDNIYTFKVKNEGTIRASYYLSLEDLELEVGEERLLDQYIHFELIRDEVNMGDYLLSNFENRKIDFGLIDPGDICTYSLRIWIDKDAGNGAMNKTFYTRLKVEAQQTNLDNETSLKVVNYTKQALGTAEIRDFTPSYEPGKTVLKNIYSKVNNPGDETLYTITIQNIGVHNLKVTYKDRYSSLLMRCSGKTVYRGTMTEECLPMDLNNDGNVNSNDFKILKQYIESHREYMNESDYILRSGETHDIVIKLHYIDDVTNPISFPALYDGDFEVLYTVVS